MTRRPDIAIVSALFGAALLAGLALRQLPWDAGFTAPATPFSRSTVPFLAPGAALLTEASARIPSGATAVVLTEPRDARLETHLYRLGLALLPGRELRPAATLDRFTPAETWSAAEYRVVVGARPASEGGALVLETRDGTVWRGSAR